MTTRERMRMFSDTRVLSAVLLLVLLAAALFMALYGIHNHSLQADEFSFGLNGTRLFNQDFFGTLFSSSPVNRGPERLAALVLLIPDHLFPTNTADMFRASHVLMAFIYALTALPAYGLARLLRLSRPASLLAAALTIVTPWMIYGTTLLNVTLATPLLIALVWATVRTAVFPSVGADLLVLVFALLNATARAGHLPFLAAAAIAIPVQVWRDRPRDVPLGESLKRYPLRLIRAHPLLLAAGTLALIFILHVGIYKIVGGQYAGAIPHDVTFWQLVHRTNLWGAMLGLGTGYIALMVGLPWVLRQAFVPRAREAGAFATTAVAMMVVYVVSTVQAPAEERYIAPLAALPAIAFVAAIIRREASIVGTAIAGVLIARAIVNWGQIDDRGPFSWMVAPARQFYSSVLRGRTSLLPIVSTHSATVVVTAAVILALLVVFFCSTRWRGGSWAGVALAVVSVLMIAGGVAQAAYNSSHWNSGEGHESWTWEQRSFIDMATHGQPAVAWDFNPDVGPIVPYAMGEAAAYNRSVKGALRLDGTPFTWSCCDGDWLFSVDPNTGAVESNRPLPRYELEPPGYKAVGFAGPIVATSPAIDLFALREIGAHPHGSYAVQNADWNGGIDRRKTVTINRFGAGRCMQLTLAGNPTEPTTFRLVQSARGRLGSSRSISRVRLKAGEVRPVRLDLRGGSGIELLVSGRPFQFGMVRRSGRIVDLTVDC